jgi:hypothetical protein
VHVEMKHASKKKKVNYVLRAANAYEAGLPIVHY